MQDRSPGGVPGSAGDAPIPGSTPLALGLRMLTRTSCQTKMGKGGKVRKVAQVYLRFRMRGLACGKVAVPENGPLSGAANSLLQADQSAPEERKSSSPGPKPWDQSPPTILFFPLPPDAARVGWERVCENQCRGNSSPGLTPGATFLRPCRGLLAQALLPVLVVGLVSAWRT